MKLVLSLAIVMAYLLLDAYQSAHILSIPFMDALTLKYEHANIFTKVIVSLLILSINLIPNPKKDEFAHSIDEDIYKVTKQISKIVISPVPLKKQLDAIASLIKKELPIDCVLIATYEKDIISVQNDDPQFREYGIQHGYAAHKETIDKNSLEHLLSTCFIEKREHLEGKVQTHNGEEKVLLYSLATKESTKPFGVLGIFTKSDFDFSLFMQSVAELLSFSIYLTYKKNASLKFQNQIAPKDDILNIPTNTILQTKIEYEYKRHLRYHTNMSIIIIEIDHIANLKNIFDETSITTLQKEFVSLVQKNIRSTDTFGKWTGDRFAIVSSDIEFRSAKNFAQKISKKLTETRFVKVGKVTCSFGITSLAPNDTISAFRTRAEGALNEAIQKGGNSIEIKILV